VALVAGCLGASVGAGFAPPLGAGAAPPPHALSTRAAVMTAMMMGVNFFMVGFSLF
jgi:hypothetical protein